MLQARKENYSCNSLLTFLQMYGSPLTGHPSESGNPFDHHPTKTEAQNVFSLWIPHQVQDNRKDILPAQTKIEKSLDSRESISTIE
jgi:hypothetical protein